MQEYKRQQIICSGQIKAGEPLSRADDWAYELQRPKIMGEQYELAKIISPKIRVRERKRSTKGQKQYAYYVYIECVQCGQKKWVLYGNLRRGISKGCRSCLQPKRFLMWLYQRIQGMEARCNNKNTWAWLHYGGRGIEFKFNSISEAYLWIQENLGIPEDKSIEIDRINNDGHYEPGNIRWSTKKQNCLHTTRPMTKAKIYRFRQLYPFVKYGDETLRKYLKNMPPEKIVERWDQCPYKKRGYGISEMPDPFIASLCKEF